MLRTVRYGLPGLLIVAGFVVLGTAGGAVEGDKERDAEAAAREYLGKHGHWPDEEHRA